MLIINIVLALVAALLLFGVIGEKDGLRQQNITIAFVAVIVLIIALNEKPNPPAMLGRME